MLRVKKEREEEDYDFGEKIPFRQIKFFLTRNVRNCQERKGLTGNIHNCQERKGFNVKCP